MYFNWKFSLFHVMIIFLTRYEAFDFHHECRKMRWDRLSILVDRVRQDLVDMGSVYLFAI